MDLAGLAMAVEEAGRIGLEAFKPGASKYPMNTPHMFS
jgi:hypothetical protein